MMSTSRGARGIKGSASVLEIDPLQLPFGGTLPQPPKDGLEELDPDEQADGYQGQHYGSQQVTEADQGAECCKDPDDCRRRDPDDRSLARQNDASTKKPDPGH